MSQFVGPFDEVLGPGGRVFRNSEDQDYCYRCLTAGYSVVQTPAITVRHFGARAYSDGGVSRLIREGTYSLGAADMKLLRCGELAAIIVIARHLVDNLAQFDLRNLLLRRGPSGLAYIAMYLRGLYASFRFDVDRRHRLYVDRQRRGG